VFILSILSESLLYGARAETKPQMNADERRFIVPGLYRRGAGSLPAGLRQWWRAEGRGLGIGERGAQKGGRFGGVLRGMMSVLCSMSA
jgi:hypothetical protein